MTNDESRLEQPYLNLLPRVESGGVGGNDGDAVGADHRGDHRGDAEDGGGPQLALPALEEDPNVVLAAIGGWEIAGHAGGDDARGVRDMEHPAEHGRYEQLEGVEDRDR